MGTEPLFDDRLCSWSTIQQGAYDVKTAIIRPKFKKNTVNSPINFVRKLYRGNAEYYF